MKVLIIEDEAPASRRLQKILNEIDPSIEILACLESIDASVNWFRENKSYDLILMDIQLSDGLSFEIFKNVEIQNPVIFTTAYDEYAIQAFKVNSIDYLLKPIDRDELRNSLEKFHKLKESYSSETPGFIELMKNIKLSGPVYKSRFLIKIGPNLVIVPANQIAYFFADNKLVYFVTYQGKKYIAENSLEELEELLDPDIFYRANRKFIININSLVNISATFSGKLKLVLQPGTTEEVSVSREKAVDFKKWIDR
jgi:DNA-binding LytR/AlgR family response regulator